MAKLKASSLCEIGEVDFITAIDVLYHIIDDDVLTANLKALLTRLRVGGYFMFTDALRTQATRRHVHFRSYGFWQKLLPALGLEYVGREPVYVVNNILFRGFRWVSWIAGPIAHFADSRSTRVSIENTAVPDNVTVHICVKVFQYFRNRKHPF